jgi:hypothetical protein
MLLRAVIERLIGHEVGNNAHGSNQALPKLSYEIYPHLPDLFCKLLAGGLPTGSAPVSSTLSASATEGVFPILQILQRAPPPESHRAQICQILFELLQTANWHIRDMTARTLVSVLGFNGAVYALSDRFQARCYHQNELHGKFLVLQHAIQEFPQKDINPGKLLYQYYTGKIPV